MGVMGLSWNEFSKKRWKQIMDGRTERLTTQQVAEYNKQIADEWKLCRDVKVANKSAESIEPNNEFISEPGSSSSTSTSKSDNIKNGDEQPDDGFFIEIYD